MPRILLLKLVFTLHFGHDVHRRRSPTARPQRERHQALSAGPSATLSQRASPAPRPTRLHRWVLARQARPCAAWHLMIPMFSLFALIHLINTSAHLVTLSPLCGRIGVAVAVAADCTSLVLLPTCCFGSSTSGSSTPTITTLTGRRHPASLNRSPTRAHAPWALRSASLCRTPTPSPRQVDGLQS